MDRTIYFGKIHINSTDIYKIYKGEIDKEKILNEMFYKLKNNVVYSKKVPYRDEEGNVREKVIDFYLTGINDLSRHDDVLVGAIIKRCNYYINDVNEKTGEVIRKPVQNKELIRFCLYPKLECIAYYTTGRFGYREFYESFEVLLNKCFDTNHIFRVTLLHKGINIESIKDEIHNIGKIKQIKIDIIPPNPDSPLCDEIRRNMEKYLEEADESNITNWSKIFKSNSTEGINVKSQLINRELDNIETLHSKLTSEEATSKGYVEVEAIGLNGRKYNTKNTKPITYVIEDDVDSDIEFARILKKKIIYLRT